MGTSLGRFLLLVAVLGTALLVYALPEAPQGARAETDDAEETNPLGANAACYVCHIPFVKEELSLVHLKAKVPCIECHGLSAAHANDEDIGATKPDVSYPRDKIDAACLKCHKHHKAPARDVVARFIGRGLSPKQPAVCTDCHGHHKIERPAEE